MGDMKPLETERSSSISEVGDTPWDPNSRLFRMEAHILDCEVDGVVPEELSGAFHRVGPDPQYPLPVGNIPFDGDGHASMFRIKNGRVDYQSKYVQTDRFKAQDAAGKLLFPMYGNPSMDDPSVEGLSRSTANTHIVPFGGKLLALKEHALPSLLDPLTLETLDANYTFGGTLPSKTFTAHPKFDSHTGNIVAFGYEADGPGSKVLSIFEYTQAGELIWSCKVDAPYISLLHDIAVTENFIAFFLQPVTKDDELMARGGIRWSWDHKENSYMGCLRRGGDGSDVQWEKCPPQGMFHIMGAFDDKERVYIDAPISTASMLPFLPIKDGSPWNPADSVTRLSRLSMDTSGKSLGSFKIEELAPISGELPRQDDRYNTVPYRYGFEVRSQADAMWNFDTVTRVDHQTGQLMDWIAAPNVMLAEPVFAPKSKDAAEGEGYILVVGTHVDKGGLADLYILDAQQLPDGPVATVKMPCAIVPQIHSWWTPEDALTA